MRIHIKLASLLFIASTLFAQTPASAADVAQMLQQLSPEQMQQLQQLTPEQRATLMQRATPNGNQGGAVQIAPMRDLPARAVGTGRLESDVRSDSADVALSKQEVFTARNADIPVVEVSSQAGADKVEVRRSYEEFMRESKPMEVNTSNLQQYGYDLFASEPSTFAPVTDIPVPPEYVLGPGDEVKVQLYGKDNLELVLTVDREGAVSFPQIGPISVAGLDFAQAKALLAEQVKQKMIGVSASITMGKLRTIRIFALGDVYRPGSYTVSGLATLSSALFASGGVKKNGSLRNVELKRNGRRVAAIDLYDFLLRGDTSKDVRLLPGDVVFVPPIGNTVSIAGEVVRPAIYELRKESTVNDVLKLAGGLMPKAYLDKALIERVAARGEQKVINLSLLGSGGSETIRNGDVIKIFAGTEFEKNQILTIGNLKRPGKYAWEQGMHVSHLISSIDDLLPETFLEYGVIERETADTREPMVIRFKLGELLDPKARGGELDLALQPRDRLYVFKRADFRQQPMVSIEGQVQNPGKYEFKRNMRLADAVLAAGGVLRDTDLGYVEVYRTEPTSHDVKLIKVNLALALAADKVNDIQLQDLDRIIIHSIYESRERETITILGEVHKPGTYPLGQDMRVSDLVLAGGNVTERAYLKQAEITRYSVVNGQRRVSEHFPVDLTAIMNGDKNADVVLQPYDVLNIRRVANWRSAELVNIQGEVMHPGAYPIEEGETLSSLLKRVGGFTDKAYPRAAVFTRESVKAEQQKQIDELVRRMDSELAARQTTVTSLRDAALQAQQQQALEAGKRLLDKMRESQATGRVVIQLARLQQTKDSEFDVKLRNGDTLVVPKMPDEVLVVGEVYNNSAILFDTDYDSGDYLRQSGITRMADTSAIYLVRADGTVDVSGGGWFSSSIGDIEPGDTIVVPQDLERMNVLDVALDWSRVTMQLGTSLAAMKTVGILK
ncbi:MAG: SLBB domain-containing protein [Gammaproteobacteria bacterium]|nr:SLBB domain-containing protein [Gammaproteobacteria bacterium]MBU1446697.1 SLBB domain-containing protein [Gammaproteobacteria bacterium]